jgi:hypothetical protein
LEGLRDVVDGVRCDVGLMYDLRFKASVGKCYQAVIVRWLFNYLLLMNLLFSFRDIRRVRH